jgi:3',5'-cyclic AMP phosphodiesterase CpdA
MSSIRLAHISDPHFTKIMLSPSQFLNKRWLGNLNQILFRHYQYQTSQIECFPDLFSQLKVDYVLLTGDLSSLSLDTEFRMAQRYVERFAEKGLKLFHLPGNHDAYTKQAEVTRRYYDFIPNEELREKRVELTPLVDGWWWLALDCSCANGIIDSNGIFYEQMEEKLLEAVERIPEGNQIILGNHFPLIGSGRPTHDLRRADALKALVRASPKIKLYLHGHDHTPYIINRQYEKLPLICNAGSCAKCNGGTFYLIDLFKEKCQLKRYRYSENLDTPWVIDLEQEFSFVRS